MNARAAFRLAGQKEMESVARLHAFSALQVTVAGNVRTLILRDFILETTCFEEKAPTLLTMK